MSLGTQPDVDLDGQPIDQLTVNTIRTLAMDAVQAAIAASGPELFELALGDATARAASATWRTTKVLRAPRRFDLLGLVHRPSATFQAQVRARTAGGRWDVLDAPPPQPRRRARPHRSGLHRYCRRVPAAPARRGRRPHGPLRPRPPPRPCTPRQGVRAPDRGACDRSARGLGRRCRAAAPSRRLRDRAGPFVHHTVTVVVRARRTHPGSSSGSRYHRALQRLERHRLQLPRRPLRRGLRGPRRRRRGGRDRRAQAPGLQQLLDRHRRPRRRSPIVAVRRPRPGVAGAPIGWKLSLHGVPVQGQVTLISGGGASNRYPAGMPVVFYASTATGTPDATSRPGERCTPNSPTLRARAARLLRGPGRRSLVRARTRRGPRRPDLRRRALRRRIVAGGVTVGSSTPPPARPGRRSRARPAARTATGPRAPSCPPAARCARSSPATARAAGSSRRRSRCASSPA